MSHRIASHRIAYLVWSARLLARSLVPFVRPSVGSFIFFFSHLSPFGTRSACRQTLQSELLQPILSRPALPTRLGTYHTRQTPPSSDLLSSSAIPSRQVSTSWYMSRCYNTAIGTDHRRFHVVVIPAYVPIVIALISVPLSLLSLRCLFAQSTPQSRAMHYLPLPPLSIITTYPLH